MLRKTLATALLLSLALGASAASAPPMPAAPNDCGTPGKDGSPAALSGIVNTYWPPTTATLAAGSTQLTVGAASGATATFPNITAGDLLLIIQMQDAAIDFNNDERYGDGTGTPGGTAGNGSGSTNLNSGGNAGYYEYVRVTSVAPSPLLVGAGGTINFESKNGAGLIHSYANANSTATAGQKRYQVIRVPQYDFVTLSNTTPVTCAPWDGTKGGILVMDVRNTINFNTGSINVNGLGFRGGGGIRQTGGTGFPTDYRTPTDTTGGDPFKCNGSKGEGIAGTPRLVFDGTSVITLSASDAGYPSGSSARGAPGNAGGGATDGDPGSMDNNAGGGGGGNGGPGGRGGDSGLLPRSQSGGFGGAVFPYSAGRVVMGGGGGAGSRKATPEGNAAASSGGRGGGIVMIRAYDVSATAGTVAANGAIGSAPTAPNGNGGGGGGAGGSILFTILSGDLSTLTLTANGAAGTNSALGGADPFGPGGGGAGGVILTSAAAGTTSVTPGAAGLTGAPAQNYGATAGTTGIKTGGFGDPPNISPSDIPGTLSGAECSTIFINDVSVVEGNAGTVTATFTVQNPSGNAVDVNWTTGNGTATTADNDYVAANNTLNFGAGETSKTIQITVNGDTTPEANETFTVTITSPTPGARIGKGTGTCTITNDDAALSINNVTALETNGATTFSFTVTLSNPSAQTITVQYATVDGTATTANNDYTAIPTTLLQFNPGETSKNIDVTVNGDTTPEANETFTVVLSNPVNAGITSGTGTGTIQNDDSNVSIGNAAAAEGNAGTTALTFTVSLDVANTTTVTVNFATADGTATTADSDYAAKSGTVTFNPGETSKQITVDVNGDTTPEANETFTVTLSSPTNAVITGATGTGTIQNDDAGISVNDVTLAEGNAGTTSFTFTVTLDFASVNTVTVDYATANGTATVADNDYSAATGTVTFNPGQTSQTVTVLVNGDTKNEADETFTLVLSSPTNGAIADGTGLGTITNDDPVPTVSIGSVTGPEGNAGTTSFLFDVTLSAESGQTVTVDFATANGTATAGADYTAAASTVTFNPGETSKQITILVAGDTTPEPDETFTVTLSNPGNASVAPGQGTGTGTIRNDESGISINDVPLAEGNAGTTGFAFTVSLDFANVNTVTVNFATADGTATVGDGDYAAAAGTVTFNPGQTSQTVTVLVNGDTKNEANETFTITLSGPTNGAIVDGTGLGTITNDDAVPTLSINDVTAAEGNSGAASFTFNVTLSAASGQTVTVDFATANGTATVADSDYTAASGPLSFAPGEILKTVTVSVTGDTKNEADETFFVNLTNPGNATIADSQGQGTITNEDALPTLSINDVAAAEGNAGSTAFTFTVTLSAASGQTVTVDFATSNGSATVANNDYAAATGTVTFNPGETSKPVTVQVTGDTTDEPNETFFVDLSNAGNATLSDNQGQGTIQNDDTNPLISIGNASVVEGNSGTATLTFTVTLSVPSGQTVTVDFATADGSATLADNDYVAASGTVTFAPGVTSQNVVVTVNGDTNDETTETVLVNLTNPANGTVGTSPGIGSIVSDDIPADLRLVKTVSNAFPSAGDTITYTLTISYTGPTDATNVTLVDKLPADVTYGASTPSQGTFDPVSGVWAAGTVPIGGSATLTIQVTVNAGTWGKTIVNSATVGSDVQNDVNPANNQSSVNIVVAIPELVIQFAGAAAGVPGVDPVVVILPSGTEGAFYQQQAFATGGLPQFHWSVASSSPSFPFNLDPDTGIFSGSPAAGTYSFRLGVSDAQNPTGSDVRDFTVTINAPSGSPLINVAPAPPGGTVGSAYSHPFTAVGGQPPYTWSVSAGLPSGLLLNASTGVVSGTPTASGVFNFTVTVTDSGAATDSKPFSITVQPVPVAVVTTSLPPGSEGSVYSQQIEAEGGIGPGFTWTLASGTLPPGLTLVGSTRTAVLSGTPSAAGTYVFTVQAADNSQAGINDTQVLIVLISGAGTQPLITTSSIPEGTVSLSYSAQLTAAGGATPYAWSLVAGTLPAGLTLAPATGLISGTPTEAGVFQIIVQVADSTGPPQTDTQDLTLVVWTLPAIVTPATLPNGLPGVPYTQNLNAVGGKAPLAWSITGGTFPPGLAFAAASGSVNGTPGGPGNASFTARVTDSNGRFDERTFSVTVLDPSTLAIVTNHLPRGITGIPYSRPIIAVGGTTPYAWSSTGLPSGLTLNPATGILSGTPTAAGGVTVTFTVTDALFATASRAIDLLIEDPLVITTVRLPDGSPGVAYATDLSFSGGTSAHSWSIVDATLPPGLSLAAASGDITGVPPRAGTWTFLAMVEDSDGHTSQKLFTIVIRPFSTGSFKAGYCGLLGLEVLMPLAALWLVRRRPCRKIGAVLAALVTIGVAGAAPASADEDRWIEAYRTLSLQEEKAPAPKTETPPAAPAEPRGDGHPFAESFEAAAHLGMIAFSSDFEADPEFAFGLSARAALPWFSKDVLGLDESRFGLFVDFTVSSISRDIPVLKEPDGTLIFFTVGLDIEAYKDDTFVLRPQLGLQYGHFGGVTDLDNGIALLLGLQAGITLSEHFRLFFNPQIGIGEDMVFFLPLGVSYSF